MCVTGNACVFTKIKRCVKGFPWPFKVWWHSVSECWKMSKRHWKHLKNLKRRPTARKICGVTKISKGCCSMWPKSLCSSSRFMPDPNRLVFAMKKCRPRRPRRWQSTVMSTIPLIFQWLYWGMCRIFASLEDCRAWPMHSFCLRKICHLLWHTLSFLFFATVNYGSIIGKVFQTEYRNRGCENVKGIEMVI